MSQLAIEASAVHSKDSDEGDTKAASAESDRAITTSFSNPKPPSRWTVWLHRGRYLGALTVPLLLETFDQTITSTAQPHIASSFGHLELQSWIGTSFILTSTAFLPLFANIADVFGRHWTLQWSLLIFLFGSSLCTGARSMPMLLAGRGITGIGAAGITTICRVIIADLRSMNENNVQTAIMTSLQGLGFIVGPVIGGALSSVSWRYVFGINLPVACISMALVYFLLRNVLQGPPIALDKSFSPSHSIISSRRSTILQKIRCVDWIGAVLFIGASILILYGLSTGSTASSGGWSSAHVITTLVLGGVLAIIFVLWEYALGGLPSQQSTGTTPTSWRSNIVSMVPLKIFRVYDVCVSYLVALAGGMALFASLYFLSIYFVIVVGYDATKSGLQLLYLAPGLGGGTYIGILMLKFLKQPRYPLILGAIIIAIGVGLISYAIGQNSSSKLNGFLAFTGVGMGMSFGPTSLQAQYSCPPALTAVVVTLNLFFRTFGGTLALAQLAAILESKLRTYITSLVLSGSLSPSDASLIYASIGSLGDSSSTGTGIDTLPPQLHGVIIEAYAYGTRWCFISLIPWCALPCFLALFLGDVSDKEEDNDKTETSPMEHGDVVDKV